MTKTVKTAPISVRPPFASVLADPNEDARICYIPLILDMSGSMAHLSRIVFDAVQQLLAALAANSNEDIEFRVQPFVFNDSVKPVTPDYLPPEQVSELFTESDYRCDGGTDLTGVVTYMNTKIFSRSAPLTKHLHSGDPKAIAVIITDYMGTDNEQHRAKVLDVLRNNPLFSKACKCICILCGSGATPADVLPLCGSLDNVVKLDPKLDFASILAPVLIRSTILLSQVGNGEQDQTPAEIADGQTKRTVTGQEGAETLTQEELAQAMADYFKNKDVDLAV